jgi:hypothetical protein
MPALSRAAGVGFDVVRETEERRLAPQPGSAGTSTAPVDIRGVLMRISGGEFGPQSDP